MDIKETGKKLKPFAPVLSVALVTACVAGSLSGYEAPVYAATQEETPAKKEETKEKKEEKFIRDQPMKIKKQCLLLRTEAHLSRLIIK